MPHGFNVYRDNVRPPNDVTVQLSNILGTFVVDVLENEFRNTGK